MKILRLLLVVVFIFLSSLVSSAQSQNFFPIKYPAYQVLAEATGFVVGQRYSLEKITKKYPDLSYLAKIASTRFDLSFGNAEKEISYELQNHFNVNYKGLIDHLRTQFAENLDLQNLSHEEAVNFITEVESRSKGNIQNSILQTLLQYQYKQNPGEEFARNYIHTYKTKGHPKAKGLELSINYPVSWSADEGLRPHVVQKFISENGKGLEMFLIMVKNLPLPQDSIFDKKYLDEFFTVSTLKAMVPSNATFISAKPITLDAQKAGVLGSRLIQIQ